LIDGNQVRYRLYNSRNLMTPLVIVPGAAVATDEFDWYEGHQKFP